MGTITVGDAARIRDMNVSLRGTIADTIIFRVRGGAQQMFPWHDQPQPRTYTQQERRVLFAFAVRAWQSLSQAEKDAYHDEAKLRGLRMTGYHLFLRGAMQEEVSPMVKNIYRGFVELAEGEHNVTVPEVALNRSVLFSNASMVGFDEAGVMRWGIVACFLSAPTTITVRVYQSVGLPLVPFVWQIVEFI